ncbi:SPOR domain-containing protein [Psychrobium sp. MM17-31]|uniref:SPOR domain-containing protein n=1 Tax=Psychrobium sp. MM17-31 TaxID=2917758 RepID=UPI001EF3DE1C|nr:SPOR domain-containing protein [Psychrobium sp. MM17-31]
MSDQIKNRVVGAIVLFALAIIFLPKIFDGEKQSQRQAFVTIPDKPTHQQPDVSKIQLDKPPAAKKETIEPKQTESEVIVTEKTAAATAASEKPIQEKLSQQKTGSAKAEQVNDAAKQSTVVTSSAKKIQTKPAIKAEGWVIRMGSFGNPNNVNALVKKLRKQGFTAYSVPAVPRSGVTNKVYVGPELSKKKLRAMQPKLKKAFKEAGVIEKYNPIQ